MKFLTIPPSLTRFRLANARVPVAKPGRPKGGEAQGVRALFAAIRERYDG